MTTTRPERTGQPGRPAQGGPLVLVTIDGWAAAWCDGELVGPKWMTDDARIAASCGQQVTLGIGGPTVTADLDTARGAAAALMAADPFRAVLAQAPPELLVEVLGLNCVTGRGPTPTVAA